ncbi:MAG: hypothetical protein H7A31_01895 [Thermotogae bacterium]|nr:hypothetical protein [Thermotogota bacterium]
MKKILVLIVIIFTVSAFSENFLKLKLNLVVNTDNWIISKLVEKIQDLAVYSYDTEVFRKTNIGEITSLTKESTESTNVVSYSAEITVNITYDASSNKVRSYGKEKNFSFDISDTLKDREEWIEYYSVELLEKIAASRFLYDDSWDTLQLTFWDGVDEYPVFYDNTLYFISDRYIGNREVYIYDMYNYKKTKLPLEVSSEYFPDISPDKKNLVFQTSMFGKWDIVLYNFETNEYKRITTDNRNAYSPYFYSDSLIIFSMDDKTNRKSTNIYMYDIIEDKTYQLTPENGIMKYRPTKFNGNSILFYGIDENSSYNTDEDVKAKVYMIKEGKENIFLNNDYSNFDVWSDGSDIFVYSQYQFGYYRIFMNVQNNPFNLTYMINDDAYYPTFSPDKKFVFFGVYFKGGEPDIFVKRINILN